MTRLAWLVMLVGCGAASADRPLTIGLGSNRDALPAALKDAGYCQIEPTISDTEIFPRCERVGSELGDSWVEATYEDDRVVRIRRWEKFGEDRHGLDRFNALVEQRAQDSAPSEDAKKALGAQQPLPNGTKTWVAFQSGGSLIGVYLLDPTPPENAQVLEEIVAPKPAQ